MPDAYILVGEYLNNAALGTFSCSSEDSDLPASNAIDRVPSTQSRFASAVADGYWENDGNEITNGGFEASTFDEGWTDGDVGAGNTCIEEAVTVKAGSKSCEFTLATAGAGNKASRYQDISVQAGQYRRLLVSLYGDGTITTKCMVKLLELGYTLQSDGTWDTTGAANVAEQSTAAWLDRDVTFQVPVIATARRREITMRVEVYLSDAGTTGAGYADECYTWPTWDFVSIHGTRNWGNMLTLQLRSSSDGFSGSDDLVASPTITVPTLWHRESSRVTDRYMRVKLVGTNYEAATVGEIVVGQALVLSRRPRPGTKEGWDWPQIRSGPAGGRVYPMTSERVRTFTVPWTWFGDTEWEEWIDQVLGISEHGRWPVVFVPLSTETGVIYADIDARFEIARETVGVRKASSVTFRELPLPNDLP